MHENESASARAKDEQEEIHAKEVARWRHAGGREWTFALLMDETTDPEVKRELATFGNHFLWQTWFCSKKERDGIDSQAELAH